MVNRGKAQALDLVAHGLGPPCLAAAFLLYFFVTWAPSGITREVICGALALAGLGATVVNVSGNSRGPRLAGAAAMMVGLAATLAVGLW
jgi:hypothetical protein